MLTLTTPFSTVQSHRLMWALQRSATRRFSERRGAPQDEVNCGLRVVHDVTMATRVSSMFIMSVSRIGESIRDRVLR